MTAKTVNYTPEQTAMLVDQYTANPNKTTVESLAKVTGKTVRSIVAKLVREGVYQKAERTTKTGEPIVKKDETADAIGMLMGFTEAETTSLTKVNKTVLVALLDLVKSVKDANVVS